MNNSEVRFRLPREKQGTAKENIRIAAKSLSAVCGGAKPPFLLEKYGAELDKCYMLLYTVMRRREI